MTQPEFQPFPKIPRLRRVVTITEKIDGTNAQVHITEAGEVYAGSRNRWIQPGKTTDNYGFAGWVEDNKTDLMKLGPGTHYGEWWGQGIQRGYGLTEKRFSLFNTARWNPENPNKPDCCGVVPVLYHGDDEHAVNLVTRDLRHGGSLAAPGFMQPEGIVVYHSASKQLYKVLLENDHLAKGQVA